MNSAAHKVRVAIQGERGAFSEEAALKLLGHDIELVPQRDFEALFSCLGEGDADYVLAPVANSIAGPVQASVDLLERSPFVKLDEVEIQIEQHLIGCPNATLDNIDTVQSHPVALAQCQRFFAEHPRLKPVIADDTAGSVAEVMRRGDSSRAAIAGRRAAELYGGSIIRESIQDRPENFTRFVLLAMKGSES
ncbi:MAG TPA: prephenate dehydratase domain-containing protein [Pyrinomonadaceae bacterium]|nr:prephenate dehydratase domain-containing protein [Pyrinomonadaceae bacterium]